MKRIYITLSIFCSKYNEKEEELSFYYNYNSTSTFEDLFDYLISFCESKICPCFNFYYNEFKINMNDKITILKNHIKGELIDSNKIFLSLRYSKCNCSETFKYFPESKIEILKLFEETQKKLVEINNNNKKLSNEIQQLKIEKESSVLLFKKQSIETKIKELEKLDEDLKEKDIINKLKIKEVQKELEDNYKIIENLEKDINQIKVNKEYNKEKNSKEKNKIIFEDFYDVIIDIQSVKDINKGWEIKMNERGKKNYELYKNKEILKIGVIGNANKGKSYLLSRISKIDLPSGTSIRTEGLSIKYPELERFKHRIIALLDSAGLETPVLRENEESEEISKELFREKSREKLITELFLQNYIIHNSDILILVVGILTYSEQKLLNRIKTEIQRTKLNKPLYIIHNLKTYVENQQVEEYINKYLLKSATFKLEEGHKASTEVNDDDEDLGIYYYEKNSNPKIFHLIFANEFSDAGQYYNNFSLQFLENAFQQQVTDLKPFDVIKTVKERFIELSKEIIDNSSFESLLSVDDLLDNKKILLEKN